MTYAATYDRQSAPASHAWYSVETPQVFREIKLPVLDRHMTAAQKRQYRNLLALAEQHGTHVRESQFRRG